MDIYEALVAHLEAQAGLTALISTKIFPDEIPQGTALPAVMYITISDNKDHYLTGQSEQESPYIQFSVLANTKVSARAVADQIKLALSDYQGDMGGVYVQYIRLENELPGLATTADGIIKKYTHDLEYEVIYVKE